MVGFVEGVNPSVCLIVKAERENHLTCASASQQGQTGG